VLRGLSARTVVIEYHYVCLDYRSEFVAYYAHLDEPMPTVTTRLHFFGARLDESHLGQLTRRQAASYLGFIVCRGGDLPIVGRTVIATPKRRRGMVADVNEPVHLFGQELAVRGVPFMQQDARMAVCANVATWQLHYSAFRRGLFERRFITDFSMIRQDSWPMRIAAPRGFNVEEAVKSLDAAGFRSITQILERRELPLPTNWDDVHGGNLEETAKDKELDDMFDAVIDVLVDGADVNITAIDEYRRYHHALSEFIEPHVRSGFPVYLGTRDHAYIACGISRTGRRDAIAIVHDDQYGPYLEAPNLATASTMEFLAQVRLAGVKVELPSRSISAPPDRGVLEVVVAYPARVFLHLDNARYRGLVRLKKALDQQRAGPQLEDAVIESSCVLIKGITYKGLARRRCRQNQAMYAAAVAQMSEWVVVVEVVKRISQTRSVSVAEVVFDASSDGDNPRVLLLRVGSAVAVQYPNGEIGVEMNSVDRPIKPILDVFDPASTVSRTA
jgi:hypothetical protein